MKMTTLKCPAQSASTKAVVSSGCSSGVSLTAGTEYAMPPNRSTIDDDLDAHARFEQRNAFAGERGHRLDSITPCLASVRRTAGACDSRTHRPAQKTDCFLVPSCQVDVQRMPSSSSTIVPPANTAATSIRPAPYVPVASSRHRASRAERIRRAHRPRRPRQ